MEFTKSHIYDGIMAGIGGLLAAIGINGFLIPAGFFDGGVTGLSMLISSLSGVPLYALILIVNIPFLIVGWRRFGGLFIVKCLATIIYFS
ncbi:MAG: YitT family protein, partial [Pseudomonadota bacterium]